MKFSPEVHTLDALAAQLVDLQLVNPDTLIAGSLGRSALFTLYRQNPMLEYDIRGEAPLHDKFEQARDIDLVHAPIPTPSFPFPVDTSCYENDEVSIRSDGSEWWLVSEKKNFAEPLHGDIIQPLGARGVADMPIRTALPRTHIALIESRGQLRKKDEVASDLLRSIADGDPNQPPEALYAPFAQLAAIKDPLATRIQQYAYRRLLPRSIENVLTPVLKKTGVLPAGTADIHYASMV
jgi:hypothetical protein